MKSIKNKRKRHNLTLLEILIVLLIIVSVAGVVGVGVVKLRKSQSFRSSSSSLSKTLDAFQQLSILEGQEVRVRLTAKEGKVDIDVEGDYPLPSLLLKNLENDRLKRGIDHLIWVSSSGEKKDESVLLTFNAPLFIAPEGVLSLQGGGEEVHLNFNGRFEPISLSSKTPSSPLGVESYYPREAYQQWELAHDQD